MSKLDQRRIRVMQLFSGQSNIVLAEKVAGELGITLGQVESSQFTNGEARVRVEQKNKNVEFRGETAILQSLSLPVDTHIIEFCLLADAISRMGTSHLIGIIPLLGYSKQDKVFLPGEPLSAKVIAQILQTTKMQKVITFDLHNRAILGFFDIPVTELSAKPLFIEYFKQSVHENTIVVAPDAGSVKASTQVAHELQVSVVYMDKQRDLITGKVEVVGMSGDVVGKEVLIVDDMIVTGSTMMEAAKFLKAKGAASVTVSATHHLYVPGVQEKLEASEIDEIVVSDTVMLHLPKSQMVNDTLGKLKILSVAGLIAEELRG